MPDLTPEQRARRQIDPQLLASGWVVQDYRQFNPSAGRGIALREAPLKSGKCDYLLLVDRKAVGVAEAKKEGTLLSGVAEQSGHYAENLPDFIQSIAPGSLPFLYESTGVETFFRDERDPSPRSRRVFTFHRPEILYGILQPGQHLPGGVPYIRPTEIVEDVIDLSSIRRTTAAIAGKYKRSALKTDDIVLSIVGTIGKVAVVPAELDGGNITQSSVRVRPRPELVSSRYVAWVLRSPVLRRQFDQHRLGTAVPRLNVAHVRALRVPVPPLPEQRRIVAEIEELFTRLEAGVAALRRVQANLKRYRAAVLKAACEGKLVPTEAELARERVGRLPPRGVPSRTKNAASGDAACNDQPYETGEQLLQRILADRRKNWNGHGKYKEPSALYVAKLPPLAEGWTWATAQQLNLSNRPCAYGVLQPGEDIPDGVPLVRVGDITNGKVDLSNLKRISPAIADRYPRTKLHGGELAITLVGAIGRTAIIPKALAGGNTARAVGIIPLAKHVNPHWVEIWFRNPAKNAEMDSKSHEVARKTLNLEDVRAASVALPPLPEQSRIVAEVERRLSVVEELEAMVSPILQRAVRLRQSILQKAFTGQLL